MSVPTIWNYNEKNNTPNTVGVTVDGVDIYFSYQTPIAIRHGGKLVVRENNWGPTTGKHLNSIDGGKKDERVSGECFKRVCAEVFQSSA